MNQSTFCGWLAGIISFQICTEFRLLGLLYVALLLLFSFSFFPPCVPSLCFVWRLLHGRFGAASVPARVRELTTRALWSGPAVTRKVCFRALLTVVTVPPSVQHASHPRNPSYHNPNHLPEF